MHGTSFDRYPEYWDFVLPGDARFGDHTWDIPGGEGYEVERDAWDALMLYLIEVMF
jgi:hypothetical protein